MAVELCNPSEHVAAAFTWDKNLVEGEMCELWADNPADDTPLAFKKKMLNDGEGVVFFPLGYDGECNLEVRGDNDSKDEGSITINSLSDE